MSDPGWLDAFGKTDVARTLAIRSRMTGKFSAVAKHLQAFEMGLIALEDIKDRHLRHALADVWYTHYKQKVFPNIIAEQEGFSFLLNHAKTIWKKHLSRRSNRAKVRWEKNQRRVKERREKRDATRKAKLLELSEDYQDAVDALLALATSDDDKDIPWESIRHEFMEDLEKLEDRDT